MEKNIMDDALDRQLAQATQRSQRYWYEDGLAELATGVLFLLIGLLFALEAGAAASWGQGLSAIGLPLLLIGGTAVVGWLIRRLKERFTYPRTGYVAYKRRQSAARRWWLAGSAAVVAAVAALLLARAPFSDAWLPALQGLIIGAFLLYLGHRLDLGRLYVLALLSALLGAAATLWVGEAIRGDALYFAGMGLVTLLSGALTLAVYLSHQRPPEAG
jgi:hypothetical protein